MPSKKISIIIPIYNVEKYLDKCLESITSQTYKDLEIILVDDGSPDNCPQICDKWAEKDSRIRVIHKQNGGVSSARNAGLDVATGDFVAFVDSDDYVEKEMYQELINKQREADFDLVFCRFNYLKEDDSTFLQHVYETDLENMCKAGDSTCLYNHSSQLEQNGDTLKIEKNVMCSIWRVLYKKSAIEDIRFSSKIRYMEDVVFHSSVVCKNDKTMGFVDKYLYNYVLRKSSASHKNNNGMINNCKDYLLEMERILSGTSYEKYLPALRFFCYSECSIVKARFGNCDLKEVKKWNTRRNYNENKKISYGFKINLKYLLVRYHLLFVLKILLKIKNG